MKNNKGITLTSLIIYIAVIFVVIAALMRITTYFSSNMQDAADVSFETEFNKLNLYLLDEAKTVENGILNISEDGTQITFTNGNTYLYNAEDKVVYLNGTIKICENVENCNFEKQVADNGKDVLILTIKINGIEKIANYVIINKNVEQTIIAEEDYIFDIAGGNENVEDLLPALPAQYQQVEYIQSSGTQYIDTEVVPSDEVGCYVDCQPLSNGTIFGAITQKAVGYYGINMISSKFEVYWEKSIGSYSSFDFNTRYEIKFNYENSNKLYVDTEDVCSLSSTDNITNNTIHLFKLNEGTTQYTQYISAKVFGFKITDGEFVIRDMVPCYRISDSVVGMYDIVNDVFYTNAGSGTFTAGPNVE